MCRMVLAGAVVLAAGMAQAVTIDTVPVGNPGNAGELSGFGAGGFGTDRICGAVNYTYNIGKYEVTAGQYTEFLNAVAKTDTYGLYSASIWSSIYGCKIERYAGNGTIADPYQYRVASEHANWPVNYVSFWDAARFCNWLHNGQPTGLQTSATTEDGAYTLNGYNGDDGRAIARNAGARWCIPTEDEWHKSAYYDADEPGGAGYWLYPTKSNSITQSMANYYSIYNFVGVGSYAYPSPYGTFDQGGNVWEWNEAIIDESTDYASRGVRGGSRNDHANYLAASDRHANDYPTFQSGSVGFRVASVPEPGSMILLVSGAIGLLGWAWRRRWKLHGLSSMIVVAVLATSFAQAGDHAPWPADWNNWSDPALLVTVGNPGNAGEWSGTSYGGLGPDRKCGAVGYIYNIAKYEVTAGQYTAFLNAVAGVDTYALYNTNMSRTDYGSGIARSGGGIVGNPYAYTVDANLANRPVNYVSWGDAARFANWLHNNRPTGVQNLSTTEDGAYYLNGATTRAALLDINRKADWKCAITSEDEWYKAAYHDKNAGLAATYFDFPTSNNSDPWWDMADVSGNNANSYRSHPFPIDSPYYTTLAGEFQLSDSPYGTFDQGGNVWEWNESVLSISSSLGRGVRGGSFIDLSGNQRASLRARVDPSSEANNIGFRVASVPEPGSLVMLAGIALTALLYWWRKRARV